MLDVWQLNSNYRDPYLQALLSEVKLTENDVESVRFTGYATTPRFLRFKQSGLGIRSTVAGWEFDATTLKASQRTVYDSIAATWGIQNGRYAVPKTGVIDTCDRIERGALVLQALVSGGLHFDAWISAVALVFYTVKDGCEQIFFDVLAYGRILALTVGRPRLSALLIRDAAGGSFAPPSLANQPNILVCLGTQVACWIGISTGPVGTHDALHQFRNPIPDFAPSLISHSAIKAVSNVSGDEMARKRF